MALKDNQLNIAGYLSFPEFTHVEAVAAAQKSGHVGVKQSGEDDAALMAKIAAGIPLGPKEKMKVKARFNLLLTQAQYDQLKADIKTKILPALIANANGRFTAAQVAQVEKQLDADMWAAGLPFRPVDDKTLAKIPDVVVSLAITQFAGQDFDLTARARDIDWLVDPANAPTLFPVALPVKEVVDPSTGKNPKHTPGARVSATVGFYITTSPSIALGAGATEATWLSEGTPLTDAATGNDSAALDLE